MNVVLPAILIDAVQEEFEVPSRWPPRGNLPARQPGPVGRRGSSCGRCLSAAQSGAGSCPPPAGSLRSFFDVVSRRSIQFPLVYEGLKVTSCLLMPGGGESGVSQPVVTPRSGWRSLRWPQVGEFGWPSGVAPLALGHWRTKHHRLCEVLRRAAPKANSRGATLGAKEPRIRGECRLAAPKS
jgi:hypothetical protein